MFLTVGNARDYFKVKSEFNQLLGFLKKDKMIDGFDNFLRITNQLNNHKELTLSANINFPSVIDVRKVKCSCGKEICKVGLNFDENVMLLTNKLGNETAMQLDKENIDEIIGWLKQIKKELK